MKSEWSTDAIKEGDKEFREKRKGQYCNTLPGYL